MSYAWVLYWLCQRFKLSSENIEGAELKIDASDQGKLELMQQDSKEMETVDEVVEIEMAAYQNYKEEVKTITQKSSQFSLYYLLLLLNWYMFTIIWKKNV